MRLSSWIIIIIINIIIIIIIKMYIVQKNTHTKKYK